MIAYGARSANRRAEQRPTRASLGESFTNARRAFRIWRRTRPFWGGLLVILGASEILVSEQAPLPVVTHIGVQGLAGYLIPTFMLLCGLLLWFSPITWIYHSLLAILLALGSWITSNLGGFFIGMLTGVVGGSLAFAWTTDAEYASPGWLTGKPRLALPAKPLDVLVRLKERMASASAPLLRRALRSGVRCCVAVSKAAAARVSASARKILASPRVSVWVRKILATARVIPPPAHLIRSSARLIPPSLPPKLARRWGHIRDAANRRLRAAATNRRSRRPPDRPGT